MGPQDFVKLAVKAATDKKAMRIVVQDLRGLSDICQLQMICSASSDRQAQAICQGIEDLVREQAGFKPLVVEGKQSGNWVLMDYGSVIVHIFLDTIRDYYAVESIWAKAKMLPLNEVGV